MFHAGTNIDILTATEELRKRGKLDDAGGPFYITQLSSRVASSAHLEYHARIVHQKYIRRIVLPSARHLVQFGQSGRDAGHSVLVFPHSPFRFHQGGLHQSVHIP